MVAIPTYQEFMRPLLEVLAGANGPVRARDAYERVSDRAGLGEAERRELLPSGKQPVYKNRIGWASTYLRFAGLVAAPQRGAWEITPAGRALLDAHPGPIDLEVLRAIPAFRDHFEGSASGAAARATAPAQFGDPEEMLERAHRLIEDAVAGELLDRVLAMHPTDFEDLVIDLLGAMGYGTGPQARVRLGRSGDAGVEGVISLDKLGLEKVYVQAKRWGRDRSVGRAEVQAFFGALAGQRATKGLFLTTAHFTREAVEYAASVSGSLMLVPGDRLVRLMIEHRVGVTVAQTYAVPKVDGDYFEG
jgi:restriction system protein